MGQRMERDTERRTGGFERESSRSKGSSLKKKTSCGHRSDTYINSAHVPHFLFFFEVMQARDGQTETERKAERGSLRF